MSDSRQPAPPSARWLAAAGPYLRRYTRRHFDGLAIAIDGPPPELSGPTIFYANHPSWWDPIVLILLIRSHYADWRFHGPIDEAALERYPWLEHLGLFGVRPNSTTGARHLLEAGSAILAQERSGLAMTAQGRFADVRQRPPGLQRGLSRLLERNPDARAVPIAIEYVFWNERLPEILVRFGSPDVTADGRPADAIHLELEARLEQELDRLAGAAMARDPRQFRRLIDGHRGVGFLQDLPLRLRSLLRRRRFDPSHAAVRRGDGANR